MGFFKNLFSGGSPLYSGDDAKTFIHARLSEATKSKVSEFDVLSIVIVLLDWIDNGLSNKYPQPAAYIRAVFLGMEKSFSLMDEDLRASAGSVSRLTDDELNLIIDAEKAYSESIGIIKQG